MDELKQQVADLEIQEADIERQLGNAETDEEERQITNDLNLVRNRLSEKREELRIAEEKEQARAVEVEQRTQAQEEHNGGLKEAIRQIFGAVCPSNLAEVVGLTEYGEMVQTFNALVEEAVNENNSALYAMIGQQIEAKDAKIQELTTLNIGLSADIQEANAMATQALEQADEADRRYTALVDEKREQDETIRKMSEDIAAYHRQIEGLQSVVQTKDEEIQRLREQLSKAPAPRSEIAPYKPSETLQDRITASSNKIKSSLELALEGSRFRGKISAVEPPAFEYPDSPATVTESDRISVAETATDVEPPISQFQADEPVQADLLLREGTAEDASPVSRAEFEARMTNVEKGMETLMRKVFGEVAA